MRTLNLWLALSPCGTDAPGLDIVPRRFDEVLPTGTDGALFDWSVSPALVAEVGRRSRRRSCAPSSRPVTRCCSTTCSCTAPASTPGMTRERWAIETWFFAPSTYPEGQIPLVY